MYSIGEFSRLSQLTVKALRLYHDKGLLVPNQVDAETGYRYYSESDRERAALITTLRTMRCSLAEIQQLLAECEHDSELLPFMREKQRRLQSEIRQLTAVSKAIDTLIQIETRERPMIRNQEIELKTLPP
ncbi:MerR family transcriptional regulator [Ferrimonas pelagia]|uniref:HTH merR-type domain-containing protein n=1 Tax=Ferrimonas pelagia TaxID=1177826 RepID=A0ABP9F001_9GAMM